MASSGSRRFLPAWYFDLTFLETSFLQWFYVFYADCLLSTKLFTQKGFCRGFPHPIVLCTQKHPKALKQTNNYPWWSTHSKTWQDSNYGSEYSFVRSLISSYSLFIHFALTIWVFVNSRFKILWDFLLNFDKFLIFRIFRILYLY